MNYASVVRVLALLMMVLAASAVACALIALMAGEQAQVASFLATAFGISVVAASVGLLTPRPRRPARPSDALAVVILWWFVSPVATALPFVFGVANPSLISGIHEAASCLTTTGQSVIRVQNEVWPQSLVVWRGLLHLIGATGAIVTAAGVLAAINLGGPGIHRTVLFTVPDASYFEAMPRIIRAVTAMIAVTLLGIVLLLLLAGSSPQRALSDAVSVLTTGLVDPSSPVRPPVTPFAGLVMSAGLVVGALGLALWLPLRIGRPVQAIRDPESVTFLGLVAIFAGAALLLGFGLADSFAWSLTTLSTSGIALTATPVHQLMPLTIDVLPALIGGSALSAAGGAKIARFVVLGRRAAQEFRQLGYRRSVLRFNFRDRELNERSVIGVWVYLIAYCVGVAVFMFGFSLGGAGFEPSIRLAIGGLTNSGGLIGAEAVGIGAGSESLLIIAMLLGRLEILALLPAFTLSFWRG